MTLAEVLEKYFRRCQVTRKRDTTIENYRINLSTFRKWWDNLYPDRTFGSINSDDIEDYILHLDSLNYKPVTLNNKLIVLRTLLIYCHEKGYCPKITVPISKEQEPDIIPFTDEQLKEIYDACLMKKSLSRIRDYTIMRLMEETGVRLGECIRIEMDDIGLKDNRISLRRYTKNKKARDVYLTPAMKKDLTIYLEARSRFLVSEKIKSNWVWIVTQSPRKGNALSLRTLQQHIEEYGKLAEIPIRVSPHTFRHTFAKNFLMSGGGVLVLKELLGHSTLEMVARYVRLFSKDRQDSYMKVMNGRNKALKRKTK